MVAAKKRRSTRPDLTAILPELLASTLAREEDLIITWETDPGSGQKTLHVMTGDLVSACMISRLKTRIEAFPEDGGRIISGTLT